MSISKFMSILLLNFLHPIFQAIKRFPISHIIHKNNPMCSPTFTKLLLIICWCYCSESILASSIPLIFKYCILFAISLFFHQVQCSSFSDLIRLYEINSDGVIKGGCEVILDISHKHTRFTNSWISNDQYFEKALAR